MDQWLQHRDDRVAENTEIGLAGISIHRIGGCAIPQVEVGCYGRGQVSARRKPHDPYFSRINSTRCRDASHRAHGALTVEHHGWVTIAILAEPIFQHESMNTSRLEPPRHLLTFMVHGQPPVSTTRTNHHCRSTGILSPVGCERGHIFSGSAQSAGCSSGPERSRDRVLGHE